MSSFKDPATYHILSYGTLLGSTTFQSFIGGIVAYKCLPRAQFSTLQKHTFPVFFGLQTLTPLAVLLSYPPGLTRLLPSSLSSLFTSTTSPSSSVLQTPTDKKAMYLITTMFVTALINWAYLGPLTAKYMSLRKHQETRDGKKSYDPAPHSKEMVDLNKRFGILHGMSTVVNLVGLVAMVWYGGVLGRGLRL